MPVCKKCHNFKKKRVLVRHEKLCIPTKKDIEHYRNSKGLSERAIENKKKRAAKKKKR